MYKQLFALLAALILFSSSQCDSCFEPREVIATLSASNTQATYRVGDELVVTADLARRTRFGGQLSVSPAGGFLATAPLRVSLDTLSGGLGIDTLRLLADEISVELINSEELRPETSSPFMDVFQQLICDEVSCRASQRIRLNAPGTYVLRLRVDGVDLLASAGDCAFPIVAHQFDDRVRTNTERLRQRLIFLNDGPTRQIRQEDNEAGVFLFFEVTE